MVLVIAALTSHHIYITARSPFTIYCWEHRSVAAVRSWAPHRTALRRLRCERQRRVLGLRCVVDSDRADGDEQSHGAADAFVLQVHRVSAALRLSGTATVEVPAHQPASDSVVAGQEDEELEGAPGEQHLGARRRGRHWIQRRAAAGCGSTAPPEIEHRSEGCGHAGTAVLGWLAAASSCRRFNLQSILWPRSGDAAMIGEVVWKVGKGLDTDARLLIMYVRTRCVVGVTRVQ